MGKPYLTTLIKSFNEDLGNTGVLRHLAVYDPRSAAFRASVDVGSGNIIGDGIKEGTTAVAKHYMTAIQAREGGPPHPAKWQQAHLDALHHEIAPVCKRIHDLELKNLTDVIEEFTKGDAAVQHPATSAFLQIAAVLPLSNASVERFFSKLRHVATRLRKYTDDNIATILFVGLECERDANGIPEQTLKKYIELFLSSNRKNAYCHLPRYLKCRDAVLHWRQTSLLRAETASIGTQVDPSDIAATTMQLVF